MDIPLRVRKIIQISKPFMFVVGRIVLNRAIKIGRFIDIDLEQKLLPNPSEHGDSFNNQKNVNDQIHPSTILNKQSNA